MSAISPNISESNALRNTPAPLGQEPNRSNNARVVEQGATRWRTRVDQAAPPMRKSAPVTLARALGWFSVGLGVAQLVMPRVVANVAGINSHPRLIRLYGAREIVQGLGILTARDATPWIWSRVAGDVLDISTVVATANPRSAQTINRKASIAALVAVTLLDAFSARALSQGRKRARVQYDYSDRSGFPKPPEQMRGAAADFETPRDIRGPAALQPLNKRPLSAASSATSSGSEII